MRSLIRFTSFTADILPLEKCQVLFITKILLQLRTAPVSATQVIRISTEGFRCVRGLGYRVETRVLGNFHQVARVQASCRCY